MILQDVFASRFKLQTDLTNLYPLFRKKSECDILVVMEMDHYFPYLMEHLKYHLGFFTEYRVYSQSRMVRSDQGVTIYYVTPDRVYARIQGCEFKYIFLYYPEFEDMLLRLTSRIR